MYYSIFFSYFGEHLKIKLSENSKGKESGPDIDKLAEILREPSSSRSGSLSEGNHNNNQNNNQNNNNDSNNNDNALVRNYSTEVMKSRPRSSSSNAVIDNLVIGVLKSQFNGGDVESTNALHRTNSNLKMNNGKEYSVQVIKSRSSSSATGVRPTFDPELLKMAAELANVKINGIKE